MFNHYAKSAALIGLLLSVGAVMPASGGSWSVAGVTQLSSSYDDNVQLTPTNPIGGWFNAAALSGQLKFQDDRFNFQMVPRLVATRYQSESELNRTERYVDLTTQWNNERGSTDLALMGTEDTTLTSEFGLTNFSVVNKKHRSGAAALNLSRTLTENLAISAQAYAAVNKYLDAKDTGLYDYNYASLAVTGSYQATERSSFLIQTTATKIVVPLQKKTLFGFEVEDGGSRFDKVNLSAMLGYSLNINPRWKATLYYGPSQFRTYSSVDKSYSYSFNVNHKYELTNLNTSYSREVGASGYGSLSQRDRINFSWSKPISEKLVTSVIATSVHTRNVLPDASLETNTLQFSDVTGDLGWLINQFWKLSISAGYSRQQSKNSETTAERNHAALNVTWNGMAHRVY